MNKRVVVILGLLLFAFSGCGPMALLPVKVEENKSLDGYKYFYMNGTGSTTSRSNVGVNVGYGVIITGDDKTVNPGDVISGYLMNRGYVRVAEMPFLHPEETFIVNYGEGNRRHHPDFHSMSCQAIILQFVSADNNDVICTITGEGYGETAAEDIRNALKRSLDYYFKIYPLEKKQ